jgi:hypothetical protein
MENSKKQTPLEGRLPDFIVVGATKAGTTSLDQYLAMHPEIHMARPKEPRFFTVGNSGSNHHRGVDWYRGLFRSERLRCGETSPQYTHWPTRSGVVDRIYALVPACRLIYLVREPWSRIRSHYYMNLSTGNTDLKFADYLSRTPHVLDAGCYGTQYLQLVKRFPKQRILVLESAHLQRDTRSTLREVFTFLEVDPTFDTPGFDHRFHVRSEKAGLSIIGQRIMKSSGVQFLKRRLSPWAFYHLRQFLTKPFFGPTPPFDVPQSLKNELNHRFEREVELLRSTSRLDLHSIEPRSPR